MCARNQCELSRPVNKLHLITQIYTSWESHSFISPQPWISCAILG